MIPELIDPISGEESKKVLPELPRDQKVMQVYKEISGFVALPPD